MILIFVGPPYAGKATQTAILSKKLHISTFSMGHLIRDAYKAGNPKAVEGFEKYSMKGLHLPISLKFDLLKEKMDAHPKGFILDNFPATAEDLRTFLAYIEERNLRIDKVFLLQISKEEMRKRKENRGRPDDEEAIILKRWEAQEKDRQSVLLYFRSQGLLEEINGKGTIEEVHRRIMDSLLPILKEEQ